jgi:hypothetical protein
MTFKNINEYMTLPVEERRQHLDLSSDCIIIGGGSQQFRGLLAHYLKTTISTKQEALLCHACNNAKCSNVAHLYWGTFSENLQDSYAAGRKTIAEQMQAKYTEEELKILRSNAGKAKRKSYGNRFTKKQLG